MNLTLGLAGVDASEQELRSLADWLQRERIPRTRVNIRAAPIVEGQMGVLPDLIEVLAPGGAGAAIALSLQTWLSTRRGSFKMRLKRSDGSEIEVEQTNVKDSDARIRDFLEGA